MANEQVNKVVYGNSTLIDLTSDDVVPADVKSGKTFHDASGTAQTGTRTINSLTPSNSSLVRLRKDFTYEVQDAGFAVSSFSRVTPTSTPLSCATDEVIGFKAPGVIVDSLTTENLTPSNSSPATITNGVMYVAQANGKAVESVTSVTPSYTYAYTIAPNRIYQPQSPGYIIKKAYDISPSNTSPADVTSGYFYQPDANGKVVSSITDITPTSTPTSVSTDDIVHVGGSGFIVSSVGIPTMTLKETARWTGAAASVSLTAGNYFAILECEGTGTPSLSISGVTVNNVIAVPRADSNTSRSFYAWYFTLDATKSATFTGSNWSNRYIFTYS